MRVSFALAMALIAVPMAAGAQTFKSSAGNLRVETVVGGLVHPWSLAFLPDGNMLVTERPGRMRIATRDGRPDFLTLHSTGILPAIAPSISATAPTAAATPMLPAPHSPIMGRRDSKK